MSREEFGTRFTVQRAPGDGNCFYHSVIQALRRQKTTAMSGWSYELHQLYDRGGIQDIRSIAAAELLRNQAEYQPFLTTPVSEYCRGVRGRAWGDAVVAAALSRALGLALYIVSVDRRSATFQLAGAGSRATTLYLLYSGTLDAGHYDSLIPT